MQPHEIVTFWCKDLTPGQWYEQDDALDDDIRQRFGAAVEAAQAGAFAQWEDTAEGTLALLILLDQFARNIFRGDGRSFVGDARARDVTRRAVARDFDQAYPMPERQFFLMPMMHSEALSDQDEGVHWMKTRLGEDWQINHLHARAHRAVIERFGRFPFRNAALGRDSTPEEAAFMAEGGYGAIVRALQSED